MKMIWVIFITHNSICKIYYAFYIYSTSQFRLVMWSVQEPRWSLYWIACTSQGGSEHLIEIIYGKGLAQYPIYNVSSLSINDDCDLCWCTQCTQCRVWHVVNTWQMVAVVLCSCWTGLEKLPHFLRLREINWALEPLVSEWWSWD
jgi:hypothetical protein